MSAYDDPVTGAALQNEFAKTEGLTGMARMDVVYSNVLGRSASRKGLRGTVSSIKQNTLYPAFISEKLLLHGNVKTEHIT